MELRARDDVLLEYESSLSSAEFVIAYTVTNRTSASIWLTTPLGRTLDDGKIVPDPQLVYAYVDPDGELHVTKRVWPVPADVDVYRPELPFSTEIRSGATFEETLRLSVPVRVTVGYAWIESGLRNSAKKPLIIESLRFSFSIDYSTERLPDKPAGEAPVRLRGDAVDLVVSVVEES